MLTLCRELGRRIRWQGRPSEEQLWAKRPMGGEVAQTDGDTYPYPVSGPGWVCFHCGERFTTPGAAENQTGNPDTRHSRQPKPTFLARVWRQLLHHIVDWPAWVQVQAADGQPVRDPTD